MSNEELRKQIRGNLNLKETDELLSIWQVNNRAHWSDEAFEVIKEILQERSVEIPEQNEAIYETKSQMAGEETPEADGLEEWEAKLLGDENQPEFYDTLDVLDIRDKINKVAIGVIVGYALFGFLKLQIVFALLQGIPLVLSDVLRALPYDLFTILSTVLQIVLVYFPLKALAHILRILMEMEFRSRKGA